MMKQSISIAWLGVAAVALTTGCPSTSTPSETSSSSGSMGSSGVASGSSAAMSSSGGVSSSRVGSSSGQQSSSRPGSSSSGSSNSGGPGVAVVAQTSLDFGATPCGTAAAAQTVTVQNTGGTAFTFTTALAGGAGSPYAVSPDSGTVNPGTTTTLTVTPAAIPGTSATPGSYGDTLTITTTAPSDTPHVVTLGQTALGAVLSFDLTRIAFGSVTVGSQADQAFQVRNQGNAPANVTLVATGAGFTVDPTAATSIPAGQAASATAGFLPTDTTPRTGTIALMLPANAPLCAPLPAPLDLTGVGRSGVLTFTPPVVDLGQVPCNTQAAPVDFTITNSGNVPLMWSAQLDDTTGRYTLTRTGGGPLNGTLAQAASQAFQVTTTAIPQYSDTTPDLYGSTITFFTDSAENPTYTLRISQTARGAILAYEPTLVDFGNIPVMTTGNAGFVVRNTGNEAAQVTLASDNTLFTLAAPGQPAPAAMTTQTAVLGDVTFNMVFAPGNDTNAQLANVSATVDGATVLCQPLPPDLLATGTGTNGQVIYTPQAVNFGNVACGTTAAAQDVVFTNPGNQAYTITAALTAGAAQYTLALTPSDGVVAPGGMATVTVTPMGIPAQSTTPGQYGGVLQVTTTAANDTPHDIPLNMNAYGAILGAPSTITLDFGNTPTNQTKDRTFTITNAGNAPATLTFANSNPVFSFLNTTAAAGTGGTVTARFGPTATVGYSDTAVMNVAPGTPLCQPLVPAAQRTFALSGTGTNMQPTIVASTLLVDYGASSCNATNAPRTVTITNTGGSLATVGEFRLLNQGNTNHNCHAAAGTDVDNDCFQVSISSTAIAANGGTATVTITPKAIPRAATTNVGEIDWSDTLHIVANNGSAETLDINLRQVATGAVLAFSPLSVTIPSGSTRQVDLTNSGNAPADVTLTLTNQTPGAAQWTLTTSNGALNGGATRASTVGYNKALLELQNRTAQLHANVTNGVLCRDAPANVMLTGTP